MDWLGDQWWFWTAYATVAIAAVAYGVRANMGLGRLPPFVRWPWGDLAFTLAIVMVVAVVVTLVGGT